MAEQAVLLSPGYIIRDEPAGDGNSLKKVFNTQHSLCITVSGIADLLGDVTPEIQVGINLTLNTGFYFPDIPGTGDIKLVVIYSDAVFLAVINPVYFCKRFKITPFTIINDIMAVQISPQTETGTDIIIPAAADI